MQVHTYGLVVSMCNFGGCMADALINSVRVVQGVQWLTGLILVWRIGTLGVLRSLE